MLGTGSTDQRLQSALCVCVCLCVCLSVCGKRGNNKKDIFSVCVCVCVCVGGSSGGDWLGLVEAVEG